MQYRSFSPTVGVEAPPPRHFPQEYFTNQYIDLDGDGGTGVARESPPAAREQS